MCTLALWHRVFDDAPLAVAANRDEFLERPTEEPQAFPSAPWIFGGRDLVAGGTWLAVSRHGVLAALLNRRSPDPPNPQRRSRGQLCLSALEHASARAAAPWIDGVDPSDYNPFSLLVADARDAWVATNADGRLVRQDLSPGLHVLTNLEVDDPRCPRIIGAKPAFSAIRARALGSRIVEAFVEPAGRVLGNHSPPGGGLCLHLGRYGTRSSSIVVRSEDGSWAWWHASGPPCETPFRPRLVEWDR